MSFTACSLDIDPISDATEITEGTSSQVGNSPTLKNRQAALDQRTNLYNLLRDRQEHWSLDKKLIADSHSDNAYAGTTGACLSRQTPLTRATVYSHETGTVTLRT